MAEPIDADYNIPLELDKWFYTILGYLQFDETYSNRGEGLEALTFCK